jgi:hypothetical protein
VTMSTSALTNPSFIVLPPLGVMSHRSVHDRTLQASFPWLTSRRRCGAPAAKLTVYSRKHANGVDSGFSPA